MSIPSLAQTSFPSESGPDQPAAIDPHLPTRPIPLGSLARRSKPPAAADQVGLGFLAPSNYPEALGRLDHYEVLAVRGQGGFGIVFRAFDEKLQRIVALKVMPPQLAACGLARKRFLREARAAAAVQHEHVVGVFAVGEGPCPYMVMEYIDGPSLQEKIDADGHLSLEEVLRIGHQTACGLAAAHQQGLMHRDIKPANILLENGVARVKITDFGLARAIDDPSLSQAGVIYGTPAYMAPEQAAGDTIDQRGDLFSLGSVLYTLATGMMPFQSGNSVAVLRRVLDDTPAPMRHSRPELPMWFEDVVGRLHAKKPSRRFQTAAEVAAVLAGHLAALQAQGAAYRPARSRRRIAAWFGAALVSVALFLGVGQVWRAAFPQTPTNQTEPPPRAAAPEPPPPSEAPTLARVPFDPVQAKRHQEAWAGHLNLPLEQVNSLGMKFRLLPPGEFAVQSDLPHPVRLTRAFYFGVHEVTVGQFRAFVDATGYQTQAETHPLGGIAWDFKLRTTAQRPSINWRSRSLAPSDDHPACCLTWHDAVAFCQWLCEHEGKPYRLPTEAEWEYACRAGTTTPYSYGPIPDLDRMHISPFGTKPVGSYPPNPFGLHDLHGNLYEWCLDARRVYSPDLAVDPRGPDDGPQRVMRGGCYSSPPFIMRSDARGSANLDHPYAGNGIRVLLECP